MKPMLAVRIPRLRKIVLGAVAVLLLYGAAGYVAIPKAVRWGLETVATRELGRAVHVEDVSANPFTLRVTLRGLTVEGTPGESAPLLTVRELTANASSASIFYRAPVLDALSIDGLTANLARTEPQRFNFSDILDRVQAKPKTDDAPPRFSLNNIYVHDSTIHFDDRPVGRTHVVSDLVLGIPFLSNLPTDVRIDVLPELSARVNGAPIEARGETRPFEDTLESSIDLALDHLDLRGYLAYLPVRPDFTIPSGALSTFLTVAFRRAAPPHGERPAVDAKMVVSGLIEVTDFEFEAPAARPKRLMAWKSLSVMLAEVEPLARRAVIDNVTLVSPTVDVLRDAEGVINWQQFVLQPLLPEPSSNPPAPVEPETPGSRRLAVTLRHATVRNGSLNFTDDSAGKFVLPLVDINAKADNLTTASTDQGQIRIDLGVADGGGRVSVEGDIGLAPVAGLLAIAAHEVRLRTVARYLAQVVNGTLDGNSEVTAVLDLAAADPDMKVLLHDIAVRGKDISLHGPKGSGADFELAGLQVDDGMIDLNARAITLGKVALQGPRATVRRLPEGEINWMQVIQTNPEPVSAGSRVAAAESSNSSWKILAKEISVERGDLRLEDLAVDPNVKVRASDITGTLHNVAGDGTERAEIALRTRFGSGGTLAVNGSARASPLASDLRFDARNLDVSAVRPYLAEYLNATLARAELSGRGRITADMASKAEPLRLTYKGNARLGNVHVLGARGESDLLKWQILDATDIDAALASGRPALTVGTVTLSDFYARIIVSEQGRLNLADLFKRGNAPATGTAVNGAATPEPLQEGSSARPPTAESAPLEREMTENTRAGAGSARTASVSLEAPDPTDAQPLIRIGKTEFTRGNVNFTDNFIKPNYTANITGLSGTVTTLASDSAEPATMALTGKIDDDAPVDIKGRLNPLAPTLFLDIEGRTKGVDLPRLTPYSVKYAGYPIVKGKLSMEVQYKVENEKLTANNHLYLDQLTFGDKVESPTATKLPVLLAVSLLKNSKGEIDINLPISGTLTDPQFSVGGLIVQVIVNLLTKVVTAPFTLLSAAFGGSEELGYVEFAPGMATIKDDQVKRLDTLAKALNERPALRVDIIGRVDPAADAEGVRNAKYEAMLKAAKTRRLVRGGSEAVDPASVTISAEERPALIAAVYSDTDVPNKPRNFLGFAKSIPAPEMEALLLSTLSVTPEDLRALANHRAAAVRNRLEDPGQVSRERLFLVEPRLTAEGIKDKGATTRVDFSLK